MAPVPTVLRAAIERQACVKLLEAREIIILVFLDAQEVSRTTDDVPKLDTLSLTADKVQPL